MPSALDEGDLLRAFPEHPLAELAQVLFALDHRREVVPGERTRLARERDVAVREQQLGLAHAAREDDQLAGARVPRRVLGPQAEVEIAPWDPATLAAPAHMDDARLEREQPAERGDRLRRVLLLEARGKLESSCGDLQHQGILAP